jgi:carbon monoxide dehydrogenase subunit G
MDINNEFRVATSPERAWSVLTDLERIAPCLPGAELQEVEGDEYRGVVKIKVGPITAQYKGKATFVERDDAARRAVLKAEGRDTRGQGNASATITATIEPEGDATVVRVSTDLHITGKVAQFGRGVLADVSSKLMQQFADNLQRDVLSADAAAAASSSSNGQSASTTPPAPPRPAEPVNLMATAGAPIAKRALPVLGTVVFLALLFRWRRRRRKSR